MIHDGKVLGLPLVDYSDTQANVEALTGVEAGMTAYATDEQSWGYYDGSDWQWVEASENLVPITRIIGAASPITVTPADGVLDEDLEIGISSATTGAEGAVELATVSETKDGTDTERAVTAAGVAGIVSLDTPATDGGIVKAGAGVLALTAAANYTLTVPATGTAALGAGTLTAATSNDVSGATHTHAITTTSDGDTNASTILQSGANGDLRVDRLGVGVAVIAASGTIALPDAGYIGNGAASARLGFDSSGATDYAYMLGANFGVGTTSPGELLELNKATGKDGTNVPRLYIHSPHNLTFDSIETIWGSIDFASDDTSNDWTGEAVRARIAVTNEIQTFGGYSGLAFYTSAFDASLDEAMRISSTGNVGINEPDPDYKHDVNGVIGVSDNAGDPSTVAGKATFYGKDVGGTVEAFAQDDAGNAAQLTAHPTGDNMPFTPEPWEHISSYSNTYLGIRRYFRIEKALRDLEALTGEQYIYDEAIPKRDWHLDQAARGKRRPRPQWMRDFIRGGN